ncbi:FAD binding domain-containing protein [Paenibacillus solisilvae]|uniref:FAD binding domain-containing protein n=1 Tax=Paenibacillus solisilvae TaxID=2486751 RepID=A0ABW0VUX6_9BACL
MSAVNDERLQSPFIWQPRSAEQAWQFKQSLGEESVYAAGATFLRTQWESGLAAMPKHLIDLGSVSGMRGVTASTKEVAIGAFTSMSVIRQDPLLLERFPLLIDAVRVIAAPGVRNQATLGGNIAAGVGDSIPALLAYDAKLVWFDGRNEITEPLADWLNNLLHLRAEPGRLLLQIRLPSEQEHPVPSVKGFSAYHKIGRRESFTPSLVTVAVNVWIDSNQRIAGSRLAAGGGQTIPHRLHASESLLHGKTIDAELLELLYEQLLLEYEPRGDLFASTEYRKRTAASLISTELWSLKL